MITTLEPLLLLPHPLLRLPHDGAPDVDAVEVLVHPLIHFEQHAVLGVVVLLNARQALGSKKEP